jgi:hypothetical protein
MRDIDAEWSDTTFYNQYLSASLNEEIDGPVNARIVEPDDSNISHCDRILHPGLECRTR